MKKLDRSLALTPLCLSNYSYLTHQWRQLTQRVDVWIEIDKIQNKFCVYCESIAEKGNGKGHIEHFFYKGNPLYTNLTFVWDNLFGCCDSRKHCGHYKDQILPGGVKRSYDPNILIKPDVDDPEEFLQFLDSGKVKAREGLTEPMRQRATETISALNLDCSELNSSREMQIDRYNKRLSILFGVEDIEILTEEYENLYAEAMGTFHRTALKQSIPW
ncbi:Uncharacterised protein [Serratia quinivorans]|uniref:retron Ec78 anti-phage system effector HNH endonuclease PtuB n=1 Tax=Serratia quinivorans TaxID=137545 RepID=UPI00217AD6FA|nr:retron Ec78 anti-phage system effector HNH endonuclease PtuB [Serratia quinivorans]CAI0839392.1 Uncharacterised protein [Serratia quinivorans]